MTVVAHAPAGPYLAVLDGLRQELHARGIDEQVNLDVDPGSASPTQSPPADAAVWVTVGSEVTEAWLRRNPARPVVGCPILFAAVLEGHGLARAVTLEFPVSVQVEWLRRMLPDRKHLGVMYEPKQNQANIDALAAAAKRAGIVLVAQAVHSPDEIPAALKQLESQSDVMLGIPDSLALSRETAKNVLLFSFQNRIPFVGVSEAWVKAGALYALERDYSDLGHQCGELVSDVLNGRAASDARVVPPRGVRYVVNLRTMRHMNLELDAELLKGAQQTFE